MKQDYVWDRFVRTFHWLLVALFCLTYITAEEVTWLHRYGGYGIVLLILLRVVWGVIGTRYARFSSFIFSPSTTVDYVKSLIKGTPLPYQGHNPAGAVMVFLLLLSLTLTCFTGLKLDASNGKGPLAETINIELIPKAYADSDDMVYEFHDREHDDEGDEFWEEIHEATANFTVLLIILHVLGVAVSSHLHNQSLIQAMLTGYKSKKD